MEAQEQIYKAAYRLPKPIADWLKATAKKNHRSMNGELVARLEHMKEKDEAGNAESIQ